MGRCIILAACEIGDMKIPLEIISKGDFIICADGGRRHAERLGITPDVILGDFDSSPEIGNGNAGSEYGGKISAAAKADAIGVSNACAAGTSKTQIIRLPAQKDDTDTAAAVKLGLARGYREFYIFGGLGGRLDHTIGNIVLLKYLADKGCKGIIAGDNSEITMIQDGSAQFKKGKYKYISVFAFGSSAECVTLSGVKYPLDNYNLANNFPLGVSNEITADTAQISVRRGALLIIQTGE